MKCQGRLARFNVNVKEGRDGFAQPIIQAVFLIPFSESNLAGLGKVSKKGALDIQFDAAQQELDFGLPGGSAKGKASASASAIPGGRKKATRKKVTKKKPRGLKVVES